MKKLSLILCMFTHLFTMEQREEEDCDTKMIEIATAKQTLPLARHQSTIVNQLSFTHSQQIQATFNEKQQEFEKRYRDLQEAIKEYEELEHIVLQETDSQKQQEYSTLLHNTYQRIAQLKEQVLTTQKKLDVFEQENQGVKQIINKFKKPKNFTSLLTIHFFDKISREKKQQKKHALCYLARKLIEHAHGRSEELLTTENIITMLFSNYLKNISIFDCHNLENITQEALRDFTQKVSRDNNVLIHASKNKNIYKNEAEFQSGAYKTESCTLPFWHRCEFLIEELKEIDEPYNQVYHTLSKLDKKEKYLKMLPKSLTDIAQSNKKTVL